MTALPLPAAFLTLPGDTSFHRLQRKLHLLALRRLLSPPRGTLPGSLARSLERLQRGVMAAARTHTGPTLAAIGQIDVLTGLLLLERGIGDEVALLAALGPDLLALLPTEALPEAILWEHPVAAIRPLALQMSPPASAMVADRSGLSLSLPSGLWALGQPRPAGVQQQAVFHALTPTLCLSTLDTNPLALEEAHPDKAGNAVDLGGRSPAVWQAALEEALALIALALPEWWAELPASLQRIVPVGFAPERHLSASYQEAPGLAYLTLHPDPLTLAEAIVHETQHSRLNTLMWLDPVLRNGRTEWGPSPVRPDIRPLNGVLLAVHAFVPVAAMHARLVAAGHPVDPHRRAAVLASNSEGMARLLSRGQPTAAGTRLLTELRALHEQLLFHGEHID